MVTMENNQHVTNIRGHTPLKRGCNASNTLTPNNAKGRASNVNTIATKLDWIMAEKNKVSGSTSDDWKTGFS